MHFKACDSCLRSQIQSYAKEDQPTDLCSGLYSAHMVALLTSWSHFGLLEDKLWLYCIIKLIPFPTCPYHIFHWNQHDTPCLNPNGPLWLSCVTQDIIVKKYSILLMVNFHSCNIAIRASRPDFASRQIVTITASNCKFLYPVAQLTAVDTEGISCLWADIDSCCEVICCFHAVRGSPSQYWC